MCLVVNDEMYQFTDADELTQAIASLRRARRQAFRYVGSVEIGGERMTEAQFNAARHPLLSGDPGSTA